MAKKIKHDTNTRYKHRIFILPVTKKRDSLRIRFSVLPKEGKMLIRAASYMRGNKRYVIKEVIFSRPSNESMQQLSGFSRMPGTADSNVNPYKEQ